MWLATYAGNANTHYHTLFCSGVCYEKDDKWLWQTVEAPTAEEQKQIVPDITAAWSRFQCDSQKNPSEFLLF